VTDAETWDARFAGATATTAASEVVVSNQGLLPGHGKALDLACGIAGTGLLLAACGLDTSVWDISARALALQHSAATDRSLSLHAQRRDCELNPPAQQSFDVICVAHFLHRPLCPQLVAALKPGGLLFYQTFLAGNYDRGGPSNPAFLLQPGELPALLEGLQQIRYQEGREGKAYYVGQRS
jgi:tellurite methyltransferase